MEPEERGGRGERGEVDGREDREDRREGEGRQRVEMREEWYMRGKRKMWERRGRERGEAERVDREGREVLESGERMGE